MWCLSWGPTLLLQLSIMLHLVRVGPMRHNWRLLTHHPCCLIRPTLSPQLKRCKRTWEICQLPLSAIKRLAEYPADSIKWFGYCISGLLQESLGVLGEGLARGGEGEGLGGFFACMWGGVGLCCAAEGCRGCGVGNGGGMGFGVREGLDGLFDVPLGRRVWLGLGIELGEDKS